MRNNVSAFPILGPHAKASSLFQGWDEVINLAFPVVFLLGSLLWLAVFGIPYVDKYADSLARIFVNIFLFNIGHNAFTFFMLLYLPEFHDWFAAHTPTKKRIIVAGWALCLLVTPPLLYVAFYLGGLTLLGVPVGLCLGTLVFLLPVHHAFKQSQGLSVVYNQQFKAIADLAEGDARTLERRVRMERALLGILFLLIMTGTAYQLFHILGYVKVHRMIRMSWLAASIGTALALVLNSWLLPRQMRVNKSIFISRFLIFPLAVMSPVLMYGKFATHGLEYWFTWRKMSTRSRFRRTKGKTIIFWTVTAAVSLLCLAAPSSGDFRAMVSTHFPSNGKILVCLALLSSTISYAHYYLDRQIFRMRDPLTRKYIGPLLAGPEGI